MYMASITDKIELFINELMNNSNSIQIKRNELANLFNCAPSQINYVLMTRFTIDRGYYIDSKKGGGGYVQITKISSDKKKYIKDNNRDIRVYKENFKLFGTIVVVVCSLVL